MVNRRIINLFSLLFYFLWPVLTSQMRLSKEDFAFHHFLPLYFFCVWAAATVMQDAYLFIRGCLFVWAEAPVKMSKMAQSWGILIWRSSTILSRLQAEIKVVMFSISIMFCSLSCSTSAVKSAVSLRFATRAFWADILFLRSYLW